MAGKRDKSSRKGEEEMKILVLGIGNPILTDDAAGILVVRALGDMDADIKEAPIGGFALLDLIRGYHKVIVVDAVKSEQERMPGTVSILEESEIRRALHASSTHDVSFFEALELGKKLFPEEMPAEIIVVGIEVEDTETFSETPTELVQNAIPEAVDLVKTLVETARQHPQ
jgi:hydrogenase maturation protease